MKKIALLSVVVTAAMFAACDDDSSTSGGSGNVVSCDMKTTASAEGLGNVTKHFCGEVDVSSVASDALKKDCVSDTEEDDGVVVSMLTKVGSGCESGYKKSCASKETSLYFYDESSEKMSCEDLIAGKDFENAVATLVSGKEPSEDKPSAEKPAADEPSKEPADEPSKEETPVAGVDASDVAFSCDLVFEGVLGDHACIEVAAENKEFASKKCNQVTTNLGTDGVSVTPGTGCVTSETLKCPVVDANIYVFGGKYATCENAVEESATVGMIRSMLGF